MDTQSGADAHKGNGKQARTGGSTICQQTEDSASRVTEKVALQPPVAPIVSERMMVTSVFVIAQHVDATGTPVGPPTTQRISTLDNNNKYRIRSVFWGDQSITNLWAPFYDKEEVFVGLDSPLLSGYNGTPINFGDRITPDMLTEWWNHHREYFVLCKGANCQPCDPD